MNKKIVSMVLGLSLVMTSGFASQINAQTTAKAAATVQSQAYKWDNVKIEAGGYVPAVIFNKTEKNLVYARTDMGGAYRLDTQTNKWIPITDNLGDWTLQGCESIATDPVDTNRVYIAAGMYTNSWQSENGYILSSQDKGNTWQKYELPFKVGGNMPGRNMGERLQIDPNDNKILYLGARSGNGLWRSEDYGKTWSKVDNFPDVGDYVQDPTYEYSADKVGVVWETFDPTTGTKGSPTQTMYVGVADNKGNSIYVTNDGGKTWSPVKGQPTGYLPQHGILASDGMMYISYSNNCGPYVGTDGQVWKYNTKTGEWTNISPTFIGDDKTGFGGISVDAQNPNNLVVATLNRWWPDEEIYRSTDAGKTWKPIWDWNGYPSRTLNYTLDYSKQPWLDWGKTGVTPPDPQVKIGWMIGDLEIDPFNPDRMFYGTGATLFGTDDLTNWDKDGKVDISVKADGIEECAVNDVVVPTKGAQLLSGVGDDCGFYHTDITKVPSKLMTTPTFSGTASIDYAESVPNFVVRVGDVDTGKNPQDKDCGISYDGGKNWFSAGSNISGVTKPGTVAAGADAKTIVWSPETGASAAYSTNNGNSWTTCSGLPQGAKVRADRVNPKKFYGFLNGKFYVSTDAGATFTQSTQTGLPTNGKGVFKAVIGHEGDIWISGGTDGLWHSTDSGATFTKVSGVDASDTVGFGKSKTDGGYPAIYMNATIGGTAGIFRSDDEGATWVRINDDEHQYGDPNYCITGDPNNYGRVYVGTNGRGIIYGDVSGDPTPTPTPSVMLGDVNGDGVINGRDIMVLTQYIAGKDVTIDQKAADVNGDGAINGRDLMLIRQYIAGKITSFTK
ncbi:dockerin type I domain-containing protein [Clostridium felsineum]|uniref:dockerin type I domain-containing protein n=1 Tax=Clostridium felsineum TaxID=36839 RepID=UPI00098C910C|nr:dockerin type I domain-containing protein [Clostridium felsineum]URZ15512.1 Xyloglucanase Xgh74A [Clostridium felsineum DSM 794]